MEHLPYVPKGTNTEIQFFLSVRGQSSFTDWSPIFPKPPYSPLAFVKTWLLTAIFPISSKSTSFFMKRAQFSVCAVVPGRCYRLFEAKWGRAFHASRGHSHSKDSRAFRASIGFLMDRGEIGQWGRTSHFGRNGPAGKIHSFGDGGSVDTQQHRCSRGIH